MKPTVTARTAMFSEPLVPLVRGADGRLMTQPSGVALPPHQVLDPIPYYQNSPAAMPSPSGWMDRDTVIPGWKNSVIVAGAIALALAGFLLTRKQVIA